MSDRPGAGDKPGEGPLEGEEQNFRKTALGDSLYTRADELSGQREEARKNLGRQERKSRDTPEGRLKVAEARERFTLADIACCDVQVKIAVWRGDGWQVAVETYQAALARESFADVRTEIAHLKLMYPSLRGEHDVEDPDRVYRTCQADELDAQAAVFDARIGLDEVNGINGAKLHVQVEAASLRVQALEIRASLANEEERPGMQLALAQARVVTADSWEQLAAYSEESCRQRGAGREAAEKAVEVAEARERAAAVRTEIASLQRDHPSLRSKDNVEDPDRVYSSCEADQLDASAGLIDAIAEIARIDEDGRTGLHARALGAAYRLNAAKIRASLVDEETRLDAQLALTGATVEVYRHGQQACSYRGGEIEREVSALTDDPQQNTNIQAVRVADTQLILSSIRLEMGWCISERMEIEGEKRERDWHVARLQGDEERVASLELEHESAELQRQTSQEKDITAARSRRDGDAVAACMARAEVYRHAIVLEPGSQRADLWHAWEMEYEERAVRIGAPEPAESLDAATAWLAVGVVDRRSGLPPEHEALHLAPSPLVWEVDGRLSAVMWTILPSLIHHTLERLDWPFPW